MCMNSANLLKKKHIPLNMFQHILQFSETSGSFEDF